MTAKFLPVQTGIRDGEHIEITSGLQDGTRVITTGAGALKDGDRIVAATPPTDARGGEGRGGGASANRTDRPASRERRDEHSAPGNPASGHDVHALGRDHPARR